MPRQPDRADAIGTAQTLASALNGLSERFDSAKDASEQRDRELAEYGRSNRHRIWVTFALFAVDIALTVAVSVFAVQAHDATSAASQNREAAATSCASGNDLRHAVSQVFDHIFGAVQPGAAQTPAQQAVQKLRIKAIEAYYHQKLAARDCTAIYGVAPSVSAVTAAGK